MDVLCIGTAVVDVMSLGMPEQEKWKEKQRIEKISFLVGGDAANQSVHLADAGLSVCLCASIGKDTNGDILKGLLKKRGVETTYIAEKNDLSTGTSLVLVGKNGERNTFSVKGAHSMLERSDLPKLGEVDSDIDREKNTPIPGAISIASLFSIPLLEEEGLLEYLMKADEQYHIPIFADLGSDKKQQGIEGIKAFLPYITYFLPSLYDALEMTGEETAEEAAEYYLNCGCKNVIIKCGEKGCYYASAKEKGWVEALPVITIDTTGAGDCMVALFIEEILAGDTMPQACRYACKGASISTMYAGASVQNITEVLKREEGFYTHPITDALFERMKGKTYPSDDSDIEISLEELAYLHILHYGFDGKVHEGELICNRLIVYDLMDIFKCLLEEKYPIEKVVLIDEYNAEDEPSMADNNSSAFNYRVIYGTKTLSNHARGLAIDINPLYNPYISTHGGKEIIQPANAGAYVDRAREFPHKITHDDLCYNLFLDHGFEWGGDWEDSKDYQHFEKVCI